MSKLTDYKDYKYGGNQNKQNRIVTMEAGFFPFLPFSFDYSLKVQQNTLLAADLAKKDGYQQFLGRYDIAGDEIPKDNLKATRSFLKIGKKDANQYGKELSDIVLEANAGVSRATKLPKNYTGEIASTVVAQDIFKQLEDSDKAFENDFDEDIITLNEELKDGARKYADKNPQTKESRKITGFYLNVLKEANFDVENVHSIEETVGLSKVIQSMVGDLSKLSPSQAELRFKNELKKHEDEINQIIRDTGITDDFMKARARIPDSGALNKYARETLSRLDDHLTYAQHNIQGDRMLYTAPFGTADTKLAYINPPQYLGAYSVMAHPQEDGGIGVKFQSAGLYDMGPGVFASLDNLVLQQAAKDSGILAGVEIGEIENISQQIANEIGLAELENSLGMEGSNLMHSMMSNTIGGSVSIAKVMSDREIASAILESFESYGKGKQEQVAQLIERMIKRSNALSISWKRATMNGLWSESPFERFDWERTKNDREDGVWKRGVEGPWNEGDGSGLSVSPYIASERLSSKDYPNLLGNRKVPFVYSQRKKRTFRPTL